MEQEYGHSVNGPLLRFIGPVEGSVLDVGCGAGGWADHLRQAGAERLIGLEPDENTAKLASTRYDSVIVSSIELATLDTSNQSTFDVIIMADVLEHLVNPWKALEQCAQWLRPTGRLIISVPNLRYFRVLSNVAIKGLFDYSDHGGVMDRTHLRWFTPRSLAGDLRRAGLIPTRIEGVASRRTAHLRRYLPGGTAELLWSQILIATTSNRSDAHEVRLGPSGTC